MNINNTIPEKGMELGRRDDRTLYFAGSYMNMFKNGAREIGENIPLQQRLPQR
jgi:hypothetical protein